MLGEHHRQRIAVGYTLMLCTCAMATPLVCRGPGWQMIALTAQGWLSAVLGRGMGSSHVRAGVRILMDGEAWVPRWLSQGSFGSVVCGALLLLWRSAVRIPASTRSVYDDCHYGRRAKFWLVHNCRNAEVWGWCCGGVDVFNIWASMEKGRYSKTSLSWVSLSRNSR